MNIPNMAHLKSYMEYVAMGDQRRYDSSPIATGIVPTRKSKRSVPDSDKDDRYWEKRKRNNEAAKKSRENKRLVEIGVRERVTILERENELLKKEISILKEKYGIPQEQCFLSQEDIESLNMMKEMKTDIESDRSSSGRQSVPPPPTPVNIPTINTNYVLPPKKAHLERSRLNESAVAEQQFNGSIAHQQFQSNPAAWGMYLTQEQVEAQMHAQLANLDALPQISNSFTVSPTYRLHKNNTSRGHVISTTSSNNPTYSSTQGRSSSDVSVPLSQAQSMASSSVGRSSPIDSPRNSLVIQDDRRSPYSPNDPRSTNVNDRDSPTKRENEDLRSRLRQLSAEVEEMKHYVMRDHYVKH